MAAPHVNGKIFGVGLNKTGTTSLAEALSILGYSAFHHRLRTLTAYEIDRRISEAVRSGRQPLATVPELDSFDAYFDMRSLETLFPDFDLAYPESRFILHTRDLNRWLDSREKHVLRNQRDPDYRGDWLTVDRDAWALEWERHHERVLEYFARRPSDLLVLDIEAGEGWEQVCSFLGDEIPPESFPRSNTAMSQGRRWRRLRAAVSASGLAR